RLYALSLHDALPILQDGDRLAAIGREGRPDLEAAPRVGGDHQPGTRCPQRGRLPLAEFFRGLWLQQVVDARRPAARAAVAHLGRSEEHTSELQSPYE